ncbi:hypothetical protein HF313_04580 [Massilia atriviolacea]|uniref:Pilus assembly protein n=1 Tax=Massilia atriviolacea TaxID=2495579 RepID=A0A430HD37_9BURK|nr:hypothetical protein [Massilia atriviolacea]RSZ55434.1 hypothetical protein EJB06_29555 [Massilia atriviolacea]
MNRAIFYAALALLALLILLAGCASAPRYDARFGDAVRQARSAMTIDPQAGGKAPLPSGIDGQAAREAMARYQDSFKTPPPVVTVINAGGPAAR